MSFFAAPANYPFNHRFYGVSRLHDDIDRLFGSFFSQPNEEGGKGESTALADFLPGMDLTSTEKEYAMHVELPGVAPENVSVKVEEGILTVSGEKKEEKKSDDERKHVAERVYGSFMRKLSLPDDADADAIKASFKDGVLTVQIPRKAPEKPKAHAIEITRA